MSKQHIVKSACVVVPVDGEDRYLYQGAPIPEGVDAERIEHLVSLGMITEVTVSSEAPLELPDGDPTDKWTGDQLKAYAAAHEIDLGDAAKKADVFAAITAALAERAEGDSTAAGAKPAA